MIEMPANPAIAGSPRSMTVRHALCLTRDILKKEAVMLPSTPTVPLKAQGADRAPLGSGRSARQEAGRTTTRKWLLLATVIVVAIAAYLGWKSFQPQRLPDGFASSNGRVEAVEIDNATKTAGR